MLAIDLDIGDIVLEDGGDVDLSQQRSAPVEANKTMHDSRSMRRIVCPAHGNEDDR